VYVVDMGNHRIQVLAPNHPVPDLVHGLALNGSFEEAPGMARWAYGGELPTVRVTDALTGTYAVRLGEPVSQTAHSEGRAWLRQTMYVRPEWERPVLSFAYRMVVNDIVDYSDFFVWLSKPNGAWLGTVLREGYCAPEAPRSAPPEGHDMGWRTARYDLSPFKGQHVRLTFENRNLHHLASWGLWTVVDDVRVVDAGPTPEPPGPYRAYLPSVRMCTVVLDDYW
jgi:hypothetical protein